MRLATSGADGVVAVSVPGDRALTLFVAGASQPVAGRTVASGERSEFRGAFPLTPGVAYRLRGGECEWAVDVPPVEVRGEAEVVAVFPRSRVVPSNLLRFYIYFSEPMREGRFLEHVRLEDGDGRVLSHVFFDNIQELWSPDRRRITLLVDPGRVKTGLRAHERWGRAFRPGERYVLTVLPSWRTISGRRLAGPVRHEFLAQVEDRERVIPEHWLTNLPDAGTREPLRVDFGEPVDHVSVAHFLDVRRGKRSLPGTWVVDPGDRSARWTPREVWEAPLADYRLVVGKRFEDIAGNNVEAEFDRHADRAHPRRWEATIERPLSPSP